MAPTNCAATPKIKLRIPPIKLSVCFGALEVPPIPFKPFIINGYKVIEAQYGNPPAPLVSSWR